MKCKRGLPTKFLSDNRNKRLEDRINSAYKRGIKPQKSKVKNK